MPTRVRSMLGYLAAAAFIHTMRSGKPESPRFFQQTSWNFLERLRGAHAVDLHDDEAQLGEGLLPELGAEALGHERRLRPGVDLLDDRVFLCRIEIRRPDDDAVNVGLPVAALGHEPLRGAPAGLEQRAPIGPFQVADQPAIARAAQLGDRRLIHSRPGVDQEGAGPAEYSIVWVPSPSVSTTRPVPSKLTRQ